MNYRYDENEDEGAVDGDIFGFPVEA